jgi:hypothetical protein
LPAASRPSIRRRISFDPKIFPMILETEPPMLARIKEDCTRQTGAKPANC